MAKLVTLRHPISPPTSLAALVAAALGGASLMALAACGPAGPQSAPPLAALPLTDGPSQPGAAAPPLSALPPARRIPTATVRDPGERYAYADQARDYGQAFGEAPPDYAFDYGGERPWAWVTNDRSLRVAEPLPDGGERWFYYRPGADAPFLVRDPQGAYGYADGRLAVVYGPDGGVLPPDAYGPRLDYAGRLLARAALLYAASQRQERFAVARADWSARRAAEDADRARWSAAEAQDADWRAYHAAHAAEADAHFADERARRQAEAARSQGFIAGVGAGAGAGIGAGLGFAAHRDDVQRQDDAARLQDDRLRAQAAERPAGPPPGPPFPGQAYGRPAGPGFTPPPAPAFAGGRPEHAFGGPQQDRNRPGVQQAQAEQAREAQRSQQQAQASQARAQVQQAQQSQRAQAEQAREAQRGQQQAQASQARAQAQQARQAQRAQAEQAREAQRNQQQAQASQARAQSQQAEQAQRAQARQAQRAQAEEAHQAQAAAHPAQPGPAAHDGGRHGEHDPGR